MGVGRKDIGGDEFGDIFADTIEGIHPHSPLGLADVTLGSTAWSVKTVKGKQSRKAKPIRLISGRNSPKFSHDIENPYTDLEETGQSILSIWNHRLNAARSKYYDTRVIVLIRDMEKKEFTLFEEEINRYPPEDYEWKKNKKDNLEGYNKTDGNHYFTWQPHGSQFTIIRHVPGSAVYFRINHDVPLIKSDYVLDKINYSDSWIEIG